jgi:C4-dicarboxylate-specific signal transduction histidine kinase
VLRVNALSLSKLHRHHVIMGQEIADDVLSVRGNRIQLERVILDLVLNAFNAMNISAIVRERLMVGVGREDDDHVWLMVQDRGMLAEREPNFGAFCTTGGERPVRERIDNRDSSLALWAVSNEGPGPHLRFQSLGNLRK